MAPSINVGKPNRISPIPIRTPNPAAGRGKFSQGGFSYLLLLAWVAISGIYLAAVGTTWSTAQQQENEAQLLYNGNQYRLAIGRFYQSGGALSRYPSSLEDLLVDPRTPALRRHLRRPLIDPMTGRSDWELIHAPEGGIMGVRSRSHQRPLKIANFDSANQAFEHLAAARGEELAYADWEFVFRPPRQVKLTLTPSR